MISIIMPLYNAVGFMEETVQSVLEQSYKEWELLIVDDCSTDGSYEKALSLAERDSRIRVFQLAENSGGPAAPRNYGIARASGEYIAFLDADDVWENQKLEKQIDFLKANNCAFTSSDLIQIDRKGNVLPFHWLDRIRKKRKKRDSLEDLIRSNFIVTSSVLIKKMYLELFTEECDFVAVEDFCMWLQIFHSYPGIYKYQPEPLVRYRVLENSISRPADADRQDAKIYLCLFRFMVRNSLTIYTKVVYGSICRKTISSIIKKVL